MRFLLLAVFLSASAFSAEWLCEGDKHSLTIDTSTKVASLTGPTTNGKSFDLNAKNLNASLSKANKEYISFSLTGPKNWKKDSRDSDAWFEMTYSFGRKTYLGTVRRLDNSTGAFEFLPVLVLECSEK